MVMSGWVLGGDDDRGQSRSAVESEPDALVCGAASAQLLVDRGEVRPAMGDVQVLHDDTTLYIKLSANEGWTLDFSAVHLAESVGDIPSSEAGPDPGAFDYFGFYEGGVASATWAFDLAELGFDTGGSVCVDQSLVLAVYAFVSEDDSEAYGEDAWAYGEQIPGFTGLAGFIPYTLTCCEDTGGDPGCTLSQGYWKNHPEDWETDGELCEQSWMDILHTPPRGDAWYILAHRYIAAELNAAAGASTADLGDALEEAADLLDDCEIDREDREYALDLADLLDDYNNGRIGPGHCDECVCDDDSSSDDDSPPTTTAFHCAMCSPVSRLSWVKCWALSIAPLPRI